MQPELRSEITCPHCGHRKLEDMPVDACQIFYSCETCSTVLRPKPGDCCIFCSYGSVPCPPVQLQRPAAAAERSLPQEARMKLAEAQQKLK